VKTSITTGQIGKIFECAQHKGTTPESFQPVIESGALALLLDPRAKFSDMPGLRRALGLAGLLLEPIGDAIEFPGDDAFCVADRFTTQNDICKGPVRFSYVGKNFLEWFGDMEVPKSSPSTLHIASVKPNTALSLAFKETGNPNGEMSLSAIYFLLEHNLLWKGVPSDGMGFFGDTGYHHFHAKDKAGELRIVTVYWNDGIQYFGDWAINASENDENKQSSFGSRLIY
jgi:hypothetical protein